jgi:cell wall-associated NlpC family hydrolase
MKALSPVLLMLAFLPQPARAQIEFDVSNGLPVVRANVAGVIVSATLGTRRGVDLRIEDPRTIGTRRTTGAASATASSILATADDYVGTRYVWGGETPSGFDCSGFVQYVFRQHGIELPRTSRQQVQVGERVALGLDALEPGDLLFFATNGSRIDHIAIYVGNNEIIHSSSSGNGVGYDNLSSKRGRWFADHHVASRRVIEDGQSLVGQLSAALRAFSQYDPPDKAPRR